jgi:hypothetical protein
MDLDGKESRRKRGVLLYKNKIPHGDSFFNAKIIES